MKKVLIIATAMVASVVAFSSCTKDNGKDGKKETIVRIATYTDMWEGTYTYQYGADGKIAAVDFKHAESVDWMDDATYTFKYTGNTLDIYKNDGADPKYTLTLNASGYCTEINDHEWDDRFFEYDAAGFLVKAIDKDATDPRSVVTIENGNIKSATRDSDVIAYTYATEKNAGGIHNALCEKTILGRWAHEAGLFGKAGANLVLSYQKNDKPAVTITYERDPKTGNITKELQDHSGDIETYSYTWEVIEK